MNADEVPAGLVDLLREFTLCVLRSRPADLNQFAAEYFARVAAGHRRATVNGPSPASAPVKTPPTANSSATSAAAVAPTIPMYVIVDDDDDAGNDSPPPPRPKQPAVTAAGGQQRYRRRKSVCGESYNPETDDGVDRHVVYPKTDAERANLVEAVRGILLFRCLEAEQTTAVVDAMFERRVAAGETVIAQGDDGDNFYVVQSGTFEVQMTRDGQTKTVCQLVDKGCFGELALLYNMPRTATVVALTDGVLWAMDRNSFRRIVLRSAYLKRKTYEHLLASVPMLGSLDPYERMNLADALTSRTFDVGDCIIREGDVADGMYFVEDGEVRVTIVRHGLETEVSRVSTGMYFGEMALVENAPRSATVYAAAAGAGSKVKVAFLERESFERLLGPCLDIMKRKMKTYQKSS